MAELLYKYVQSEGTYLRTDGVWGFEGGPSFDPGPSGAAIAVAPSGKLFLVDPNRHLWERTGPSTWVDHGAANIDYRSKFFVVDDDTVWLNGDNSFAQHAVKWTRSGGFAAESFPGYTAISTGGAGAVYVRPSGEVLVAEDTVDSGQRAIHIWRRDLAGVWTQRTRQNIGSGANTAEIWSVDGNEIWSGANSSAQYTKSVDGGLTWSALTPVGGGVSGGLRGVRGVATNNLWLLFGNAQVVRWNGATFDPAEATGANAPSGLELLGGKLIVDWQVNKHQIRQRNGSWATDTITGAGAGSQGTNYGTTIAATIPPDTTPPVTGNKSPTPDTVVDATTPLVFDLTDLAPGLDINSVIIWINGLRAWENNAATDAFTASKSPITDGFRYTVFPRFAQWWRPNNRVTVRVYAQDGDGNELDETWAFFTNNVAVLVDDQFDDGSLGLDLLAGNGSFADDATDLVVSNTGGQNLDWWTFGRSAAVAYKLFNKSGLKKLYIETVMSDRTTADPNFSHTMWGFYKDDFNLYWIYTHDSGPNVNFHAYSVVANSWVFLGSFSGNPVTLPTPIRMVWDLEAGTVSWQIDAGAGWVNIVNSAAIAFEPDRVFFANKNWSSLPAQTTKYDSYTVWGEIAADADTTLDADQGAYEDGPLRVLSPGGPPKHQSPQLESGVPRAGAGQRIPGPPHQTLGSTGPFDVGAYEDGPLSVEVISRDALRDVAAYEDLIIHRLSALPEFRETTFDVEGHPHFTAVTAGEVHPWIFAYVDTSLEPWGNPTLNNFTGYAANGRHYTNGVEDGGPVWAPWATETPGNDRSSRADFPTKALVVGTRESVVIFDLDSYTGAVNSLKVWMRFRIDTTGANFFALGRIAWSLQSLTMVNGVLVVGSQYNGTEPGGLFLLDFKRDGVQDAGQLIRSDGHWRPFAGKNLTHRNLGSFWEGGASSFRIDDEYVYRVQAVVSGTQDMYVVEVGEDYPRVLWFQNNVVQWVHGVLGSDLGSIDLSDHWYRNASLDSEGWLWSTVDNTLFCNELYYKERWIEHTKKHRLQRSVDLPYKIRHIAAARDYIYCATDAGVYQVNRGTLEYWLAYTIVGGGGGGRLNNPPDGELIVGGGTQPRYLSVVNGPVASYLAIGTSWDSESHLSPDGGGGTTLIRLFDDAVVASKVYPAIAEDGVWSHFIVPQ